MESTKDIYIQFPAGTTLSLYPQSGVLSANGTETKTQKDIIKVLSLCSQGLSLYESIRQHTSTLSEKDRATLFQAIPIGIAGLVADGIIQTADCPSDEKVSIINEEQTFYPQSLHIELTRKCNLKCYYCYNNSKIDVTENRIPTRDLLRTLDELVLKGLQIVELTGGEPLLHEDFFEILDFCCKKLSIVSVLTNGTLIDERFIEKIKPYKNKIVFSISLDSYQETEHESKSGVKGSHHKTTEAIKALSHNGFTVRAAMAVDETNWRQIEKTLLFAKSIGATKFTFSPIIPVGRAKNDPLLVHATPSDVEKQIKQIIETHSDFLHMLDDCSKESAGQAGGCGAGHRTYVMNPEGSIRMCASFEERPIGNVREQTLKAIFSNERCLLSSRLMPPTTETCQSCQHAYFCIGCSLRAAKRANEIGIENCHWAQSDTTVRQWLSGIRHR